jgi:hypothetical protein
MKGTLLMVGSDLRNGSFPEEWMVLGAELRDAIVDLAFGRYEGKVLLERVRKFGEDRVKVSESVYIEGFNQVVLLGL